MKPKTTALVMAAGAVAANIAFLALGSVFGYPDVLQEPGAEVLASFRTHQPAVMAGFAVLALGAGLMAPMAIGVRRLTQGRLGQAAVVVGLLAAVAQVAGLSRWLLLVPTYAWQAADPARTENAVSHFETASAILGQGIGETLGYALTAAWTLLVLASLRRRPGAWFTVLGAASGLLVLSGVLIPLGVPGTDLANFLGYVLWSAWLLAFAVVVWRMPAPVRSEVVLAA